MTRAYTRELASYIVKETYENLPAEVTGMLKKCVLDTLGCAVAGNPRPEIRALLKSLMVEGETGPAMVWGGGDRVPMGAALMANGSMSHAVELDDLHKPSKIHAGTVIVPAVLTVGALYGIGGREALLAMAVGYETMIRTAMAIGVDSHRKRGWHGTATCGAFGAAAAIGKLLGLDEKQMANALGLAGTSTGGLMAYTADGSMSKRYHAGMAALHGWMAAMAAKNGFTGPTYVFEAPDGGYAHAVSDAYDLDVMVEGLGERYHTRDMGHKFYACCGHIHQAIDCAIRLRNEQGLKPADIASVQVHTYDVAGMSWGFSEPPRNTVEAQFSIPYAVAVALLDGGAFISQFAQERLSDPDILALAARVTVETKDEYTARYPGEWCSSVTITTVDGKTFYAESCGAKGDPVNPLSDEEIITKYRSLTEGILDNSRREEIVRLAGKLDTLENIAELNDQLLF